MALIALSYRDLLCCVVLLLKLGLVLFWLGITQPQDFIGSSLILSNMLLIDRLATPVDPRLDSNALLCLVFAGRILQVFFILLLCILCGLKFFRLHGRSCAATTGCPSRWATRRSRAPPPSPGRPSGCWW